jgi:hypothetical protein
MLDREKIESMCTKWAEFMNTVEISEEYEEHEQQKSGMKHGKKS